MTRPLAGHLAKAGVEPARVLREFLVESAAEIKAGDSLSVELFAVGQFVDVTGVSIGKGFAVSIKRHNFSSNRESHGNSVTTRAPGSIGMAQDPGRVFPGKRMAGHLGDAKVTQQNLEVVRVDAERQLLLVKGAVPGAKGGDVVIRPAVKSAS
jgi:large subunit ribosomal protein L3